jgi:hypothetical protein
MGVVGNGVHGTLTAYFVAVAMERTITSLCEDRLDMVLQACLAWGYEAWGQRTRRFTPMQQYSNTARKRRAGIVAEMAQTAKCITRRLTQSIQASGLQ